MPGSSIHLTVAIPFLVLALSGNLLSAQTASPKTLLKTPEDSSLSPFTGYTRDHWLEICERMIITGEAKLSGHQLVISALILQVFQVV